jgi:POT family proton-dependent oligopeptide transporter
MTSNQNQKHPRGLTVLFATEMWERYNFYGMRAILILFMTKAMLFSKEFSSQLYGGYMSLIYLTPLVGGYIADRFWGNKKSIIIGGLVMAIGEFILFFSGSTFETNPQLSSFLFFTGLGFMITGNGFFKANISSLVGQLYPKGDSRIDAAYTIFYMGINVGGALGPFVCGLFGDTGNPVDFKWAFLAGGIGMLISVLTQVLYHKKYVVDPDNQVLGLAPADAPSWSKNIGFVVVAIGAVLCLSTGLLFVDSGLANINHVGFTVMGMEFSTSMITNIFFLLVASIITIALIIFTDKTLSKLEKSKVLVIFVVSFFVVFFWSAFEQAGASLTFFADEQTQRDLGFFVVPASFFQSLNSIFVVTLAPVFAWFWVKLGKNDPSSPTKMAIGLFLLALGYLWIAFGVKDVQPGVKVSMIWLTVMYLMHTSGELCLSPIGLSLVNKLAPIKFASMLMAVWFTANAFANYLMGILSKLYPEGEKAKVFLGYSIKNNYDFFMLFVIMSGLAAIILFIISSKLQYLMKK